jgi:hypothetical protein
LCVCIHSSMNCPSCRYLPLLGLYFQDIAVCLAGGLASLLWPEGWKLLRNKVRAA